jgi:hypothetical protein
MIAQIATTNQNPETTPKSITKTPPEMIVRGIATTIAPIHAQILTLATQKATTAPRAQIATKPTINANKTRGLKLNLKPTQRLRKTMKAPVHLLSVHVASAKIAMPKGVVVNAPLDAVNAAHAVRTTSPT